MVFKDSADTAIPELAGLQRRAAIVGIAASAVSVIGLLINPTQFLQSYLMAYMWCLGATLGCLGLGMIHQLSGGEWGVLLRRPIGAASRVLPVLTVLFVPILLGMTRLYPWTDANLVANDEVLHHKHLYLNIPFFLVRAVVYFTAWNWLVFLLNRWSLQQDTNPDPRIARRMQKLSGGGLVVYGLTITLASFDWLMSLDPHWFSTMYGVLTIGGQGLTAIAFLIIVVVWLSRRPPLRAIVLPSHLHDLGNLMLAFTMLWAYFAFSQYLIIWSGNLPAEIDWYLHRSFTSWRIIALSLVVTHFALPFVLLLSRRIKRQAELIVKVAVWVLAVRLLDMLWLVAPAFHHDGLSVSWMDVTLPIALGGIWLTAFIWQLRGRAILPVHDPEFEETLGEIIERRQQPGTAH